jgi:hypothetical protein
MKEWMGNHRQQIMTLLLCIWFVFIIWGIMHGKLTGVQIVCVILWLPVCVVIIVNNLKNMILHNAMISLNYGIFAIYLWTRDKSFIGRLFFVSFLFFALVLGIGTLDSIATRKSQKKRID